MRLSLLLSIWCCAVILPVNMSGHALDSLLNQQANVRAGSRRLWVHLGSIYLLTALVMKLLWRQCREVAALRVAHMAGVFDQRSSVAAPGTGIRTAASSARSSFSGTAAESVTHIGSVVRKHDPHAGSAASAVAARSVLITDIPGTPSGTLLTAARSFIWGATVLRFLPK
ncbi:ERD4-related membrane protein [Haematococcus lacustris]|uniref:ERD4-related membrane protein n=1 Tax=Haematococcus lacustris TaxID=44745 RepID=A0A699ZSR8_HAELA|nr:ERD4-related membrane protein [Haematococcus lacustris]